MRDFTLVMYQKLLEAYQEAGYGALQYQEFIQRNPAGRLVVLRHDVDKLPENSLTVARIEAALGMRGTFYFRIVPESFDPACIDQIADLGHEIGLHYESLALCHGNRERALDHFQVSLEQLRKHYPVTTMCMHGSPLSKWDNRRLWMDADYADFGIVAEPYFDTDFDDVFYLTDTGRSWNNPLASVRDKVNCGFDLAVRTTGKIIELLGNDRFPDRVMQNIHPQRWVDNPVAWTYELISQKSKNVLKRSFLVKPKSPQGKPGAGLQIGGHPLTEKS